MESQIFRKSSMERISSPEELNDYLSVARPGVWVILSAAALLVAGFLLFGMFGTIPSTVTAAGLARGGEAVCYVSDVTRIKPGMPARVGESEGKVTAISLIPLSSGEVDEAHAEDYVVFKLDPKAWNYPVTVSAPGVPDGMHEVVITTQSIRPISFLLDGQAGDE
ncbi:MAG: hypothetical protein GX623_03345 [Clostridiales bacterium]|nr:hypothetical protein [Clostridiales bacterium]